MDRNTVKYMIEEQALHIDKYKAAQRSAIEHLLHENMSAEKIANILMCEIAYVNEIKEGLQTE